ncbi:unnamed protein product [Brugia pahangi]|uniref:Secreted protein n=1 Tax=Brugia pahangi TaxID=6280 RepID=A0A0N4TIZ2_BRUPA|nr:unnamed protein product [Brugia pahangi]
MLYLIYAYTFARGISGAVDGFLLWSAFSPTVSHSLFSFIWEKSGIFVCVIPQLFQSLKKDGKLVRSQKKHEKVTHLSDSSNSHTLSSTIVTKHCNRFSDRSNEYDIFPLSTILNGMAKQKCKKESKVADIVQLQLL